MTITSSVISGNSAGPSGGNGGGIYNDNGLTITNSTISGNTVAGGGNGAGLYHDGDALTMDRSTVSGNTASGGGDGGGIYVDGIDAAITNVTISGNTASAGGGLFNNGSGVTISATTIASNTGGGIGNSGTGVSLIGTIIANNGVNCTGTVTDSGTNLQFPGTTCGASITSSADPLLQPLANNGGPTLTMALAAGSPAIDTNTEDCPPPATDQRGVSRPQGSACDIGAFEFQVAVVGPPTLSINNVSANEGNSGTTAFVFTVTLSAASTSTVTVNFVTADGTATALSGDYQAASGMVTFAPGVLTQPITVNVNGDTTVEPNETFFVNISSPTNATIAGATGTGTIVNDDRAPASPTAIVPTLSDIFLLLLAVALAWLAANRLRLQRTR